MADQADPQEGMDVSDKGKGRAVDDVSMDEDDDSESGEEEESGQEDQGEPEGEDEDNMEEIDTSNIINDGRRTRGNKNIDYAAAAEKIPPDERFGGEDEDDEDDEFEAPAEGDEMEQ